MEATPVHTTVEYLRKLKAARKQGFKGVCVTDLTWLVDMAINRRAGWLDDPSTSRGSAMPINGKYPKKASGDSYNHLRLLAREINAPRRIVRLGQLGEWRKLILKRLPNRIWKED